MRRIMFEAIYNKMTALWLVLMLIFGMGLPIISAWATGFTPVSQCFRDAGAPNWKMQLYSSGVANTNVPLTAASGVDTAGSGWLRLTDNNSAGNESGTAYYNLPINVSQLGIQASFSYTAWGGNGADGISLFLFDGATTPANFTQGVFGGGLGYCQQGGDTKVSSSCIGCASCEASGTCSSSSTCGSTGKSSCSSCNTSTCEVNGYTPLVGLSNAVLGVGIDDYGNFENSLDRCPNYGETVATTSSSANGRSNMNGTTNSYGTIGVRGPGNGQAGYSWLADTNNKTTPNITPTWYTQAGTGSSAVRPTSSQFYRDVLVNISPTIVGNTSSYTITTSWATTVGGAYTQLLSVAYPVGQTCSSTIACPTGKGLTCTSTTTTLGQCIVGTLNDTAFTLPTTTGDAWTPLPPTVKFGFAASTGGSTNYHEIQDAYFTEGLPDIAITQNTASASGGLGTFVVTVTNLGSTVATNASLSATFSGLNNVLWSCVATTNSSCPAASGAGAPSNASFSLGIVGNVTFLFQGIAAQGATISDTVSISGATGFNDADLSSNTSSTSLAITTSTASAQINLSQLPQTSNSATANTVTAGQVQTNTQVYVSQYNSSNWWGDLLSYGLVTSNGIITGIASTADWSASCDLTGGICPLVNGSSSTAKVTAQTPGSRTILSWSGSTGIPFEWSNLTSTGTNNEQSALSSDPVISSSSL